jgi:hypothetical protein
LYRSDLDLLSDDPDTENILFGLTESLSVAKYPAREGLIQLIIFLLAQRKEYSELQKYMEIARSEGIDILQSPVIFMGELQLRRMYYTYLVQSSGTYEFQFQEYEPLLLALDQDIASPNVPMDVRLQAIMLKARMSLHETFGPIPALYERLAFLREYINLIGKMPELTEFYVALVKEEFPEFQDNVPDEAYFLLNAYQFLAQQFYKKSKTVLLEHLSTKNNDFTQRTIEYIGHMLDIIVETLLLFPNADSMFQKVILDNKTSVISVLEYWSQEQDKNRAYYKDFVDQNNLPQGHVYPSNIRSYPPYALDPRNISIFPAIATKQ